jgi:hypothetical protein
VDPPLWGPTIDFLIGVHNLREFHIQTLWLAFTYLGIFSVQLAANSDQNMWRLAAMTCLMLASKVNESQRDCLTARACARNPLLNSRFVVDCRRMIALELKIVGYLHCDLFLPTSCDFIRHFLAVLARGEPEICIVDRLVKTLVYFYAEKAFQSLHVATDLLPSELAAGCVYSAILCKLQHQYGVNHPHPINPSGPPVVQPWPRINPPDATPLENHLYVSSLLDTLWSEALSYESDITAEEARQCAEIVLSVPPLSASALQQKYSDRNFCRVAALPLPLMTLP